MKRRSPAAGNYLRAFRDGVTGPEPELLEGVGKAFATAFDGPESFADNIRALRAAGADIIVDDVIYVTDRDEGLVVLAERIQTIPDNFTKFAVVGTKDAGLGTPDKTSLVMAVHDRPGSLLASLKPFAERGINLTKLESRPRRGATGA